MTAIPSLGSYSFGGKHEYLLTFDGADGEKASANKDARLLMIPPLFEEMNRMRHTLVQSMRILSARGIPCAVPDLPGCNESQALLADQSLSIWHDAAKIAAQEFAATHILSLRGGCLIDDIGLPILRLSPAQGASILRKMIRTRIAGDKESGIETSAEKLTQQAQFNPVELAGHNIGPALWAELENAQPANCENTQEVKNADISGSALWLRTEPQYDADMANGLAAAIASWMTPA